MGHNGQNSALTPDVSQWEIYFPTLTAGIGMGVPTGTPQDGDRIAITFLQDGTGGRTVGWNGIYKQNWVDTNNTAGKRSRIEFEYDAAQAIWNEVSYVGYL